jgi:tRNA U34 2-thiouridine synthase MnmA/TrmU
MAVTAVALSGGADSSFAAYLLKERGSVMGLFALLSQADPETEIARIKKFAYG